jgi:hypothetical protein
LAIVEGEFEDVTAQWLRWLDAEGQPLATSYERSNQEAQRAEQEAQRAEQEAQRADREARRAKKLAAKLKELGIDPDKL